MISVPGSEEEEQIFQTLSSHCLKETQRFFASEDSPLKEASEHGGRVYEYRPQQAKMACAVAEAFEKSRHLCVEAPTGVGKSFAYLIPAIYQAVSMHRPVVVTTETINLQEQLIRKDLVLLRKLMKINFSFALAAGRANYLCKRRLTLASGEFQEELLPSEDMESELEKLVRWSEESASGFFTDLPFKVERTLWACVCSETASCSGAECRFFHNCFFLFSDRSCCVFAFLFSIMMVPEITSWPILPAGIILALIADLAFAFVTQQKLRTISHGISA